MSNPAPEAPSRRIVLVVEDEFLLAIELERALRGAGYDVLGPAATVDRALELLRNGMPDVAVLDVTLGNEKVTPVALLLKSQHVPFVLASASDSAELARHDVLTGVHNVGKPVNMKHLLDVLYLI